MASVNEIFRCFGPEYLQRYAQAMPKTHRKVIDAMIACRTEACVLAIYQCETCAGSHQLYRSCGNRHCPTCQQHKTRQWLEKQINRQLPTHHFLFTFTVPENLRPLMRKNQRAAYSALFKTSSDAIKKLALDRLRSLIKMTDGFNVDLPKNELQPRRPFPCPSCGGLLKLRFLLSPTQILLWSG